MQGTGKRLRWSRFLDRATGRSVIVPIDHGLTCGPISGLESVRAVAKWIGDRSIHGIIAHKGMVARLVDARALGHAGLMVHLNGMTALAEQPDTKELLTTVDTALRLGADAVSVQLSFTRDNVAHNFRLLGSVVDVASTWGLPVLAMVYDKTAPAPQERLVRMRHLVRSAYELGVDAVKIEPPSLTSEISALLDGLAADVAVFFSGGPLGDLDQLLEVAARAVAHGAVGVCVGRNVFQRPDRTFVLRMLHETVCGGKRNIGLQEEQSSGRADTVEGSEAAVRLAVE